MAIIISSDTIKESLPNYDPNHAELFQDKSRLIADKGFLKALKKINYLTSIQLTETDIIEIIKSKL